MIKSLLSKEELQKKYTQELPEELRQLLAHLSSIIGHGHSDLILDECLTWIEVVNNPKILRQYQDERAATQVSEGELETELSNYKEISVEQFLAIAVLGLRLIYHVDFNATADPVNAAVGRSVVLDSQTLLDLFDAGTLPQYSIHGNETDWLGEFAHTIAKTFEKIGDIEKAKEIIRTKLVEFSGKEAQGDLTRAQKSVQGVLLYRLGQLVKDLSDQLSGVLIEKDAAQFNQDRLVSVAAGTLVSALNPNYSADWSIRARAARESLNALWFSAKREPVGTTKSIVRGLFKSL